MARPSLSAKGTPECPAAVDRTSLRRGIAARSYHARGVPAGSGLRRGQGVRAGDEQ